MLFLAVDAFSRTIFDFNTAFVVAWSLNANGASVDLHHGVVVVVCIAVAHIRVHVHIVVVFIFIGFRVGFSGRRGRRSMAARHVCLVEIFITHDPYETSVFRG